MQLLVDKEYRALEQLSGGRRLSASAMEYAVSDFGRTLMMPPDGSFFADVVPIASTTSISWSIVLPLYSIEEGLSDLSLELTVEKLDNRLFSVEIEDLHVR